VAVKEGGRTRKISKGEVAMTQLVNGAAKGNLGALRLLLDLERRREGAATLTSAGPPAEESRPNPECPSPDYSKMTTRELEILFAAQIMGGKRERPPPPVPPSGPEESDDQ
jgi:hypothetical protein